jgi:heme exporter protein D
MNWGSASEFFAMGGYALYVWGSFGVTAGLIVVEIVLLGGRRRAALERLSEGRR